MGPDDFDFDLPDRLIAVRPARPRSSARLLVARAKTIGDRIVRDLPDILRRGDRLVLNDTRVIPARLSGVRRRGEALARVEVTLLEPTRTGDWRALLKPLRKVRPGEVIEFAAGFRATLVSVTDGTATLTLSAEHGLNAALDRHGQMPLPPYIAARRPADDEDRTDYQTVWARHPGAVAAPTASLHFDEPLLERLAARGIQTTRVTLHVGAGTFLPVKVDKVEDHRMHAERGEVSQRAADEVNATRAAGGRIIPVGTTALRVVETAADPDGKLHPWSGATDIFIYPGYRFRITDALMTNFHLPKSTLMMLVSALMGPRRIREIYGHAVAHEYRFFSYGDASLLDPDG